MAYKHKLLITIFFSDKPEKFTLTFRLAENYPVDLYYLMDLSNSMKDDKEKLAALGNKIGRLLSTSSYSCSAE